MEAAMKQLLLAIPPEWVALGAVCGLMVVGAIIVVACVAAIALGLGYLGTQYYEDVNRIEAMRGLPIDSHGMHRPEHRVDIIYDETTDRSRKP
jgi:hypothetical protein